jgi:hypothetical protein
MNEKLEVIRLLAKKDGSIFFDRKKGFKKGDAS